MASQGPRAHAPEPCEENGMATARSIEDELVRLRDFTFVTVRMTDGVVAQIHVTSLSRRAPKNIVRDVQSILLNRFDLHVDPRIVSVAYIDRLEDPDRTSMN